MMRINTLLAITSGLSVITGVLWRWPVMVIAVFAFVCGGMVVSLLYMRDRLDLKQVIADEKARQVELVAEHDRFMAALTRDEPAETWDGWIDRAASHEFAKRSQPPSR